MRFTAERYTPEASESLGQEVVALYHVFAYTFAANLLSPGDRVLDLGFGDGYGSQILRTAGAEYVGIEVDPDAVAHARRRYEGDFRVYDGVNLPGERFDLVTCFQVIEYLAEPEHLISQIASCTAEALFTTPNRDVRLRPGERPWNRFHAHEYSDDELADMLGRHFPEVSVSFVRAAPEIEAVELARIGRARKLARIDLLGLRYLLPGAIDTWLRGRLRSSTRPPVDLNVDRLWLDDGAGLDLLARARSASQLASP